MVKHLQAREKSNRIVHARRRPRPLAVKAVPAGDPGQFSGPACNHAVNAALAPFLAHWIQELIDQGELAVEGHTIHVQGTEFGSSRREKS